jgi:hypothetical protein
MDESPSTLTVVWVVGVLALAIIGLIALLGWLIL